MQDEAGNYAADLAEMANTERHSEVAEFLRRECSAARANSCDVLGVPIDSSLLDIRKAYLGKAREFHPDRLVCNAMSDDATFDTIRKAYEHLTVGGGNGSQCNPAHSLNLMLQATNHESRTVGEMDDDDCFKARLIAVLLEYGDKGLDLCNFKKKWKQVWPEVPFPQEAENEGRRRKGGLSAFILQKAGDVVDVVVPSKGKGSIRVIPKNCTQSKVARFAASLTDDSIL